jgi:alkylhydroperoxidase family enzyme
VRAAVRYARALVLEHDPAVFDDVYADLHAVFDDGEIVELGCFAAIAIGGVMLSRSLQIDAA